MGYIKQTFIANQILTAAEMNQIEENAAQIRKCEISSAEPATSEKGVLWMYNGADPWALRVADTSSTWINLLNVYESERISRPLYPSNASINSTSAITSSHEAFESATISSLSNLESATGTSLAAITSSHEALVSSYTFFEANFATDLYSALVAFDVI